MGKQGDQIMEAAQGKVDGLLGATFAKPRGSQTAASGGGGAARMIGQNRAGGNVASAAQVGIELADPGAVGVTSTTLVTMSVGVGLTGKIKEVKEVLSTVPLDAIDSLEVKRMGMAGVMEITTGGETFKLEGKAGDMKDFEEAFKGARGS